ncbi:MAG: flagellar basal body P-ring protein FlgI [Betaproteobacteria bacterium]|nr:flagellar basal body P-ring protein FlgI [Betaproteobacteria bacterium]
MLRRLLRTAVLALLALALAAPVASGAAQRIKDIAMLAGVRTNQLVGYGVVVGLDGTGDQTTQTPFTTQALISMLNQMGLTLPASALQLRNVAAVMVTSQLPAFAQPGQLIDITVSSMGNARSLKGGTLLLTPLRGVDGQVYAIAQGNVLIAGAGGQAGGTSVTVNHLNAGRIPGGATVERAVQAALGQGDHITFETMDTDFTTVTRIVDTINAAVGPGMATASDARRVQVRAPLDPTQRVGFISRIENLLVNTAEAAPKVIVNSRTGSVVMNTRVNVTNCAVAHGNLQVTIQSTPEVSQPNPLSQGQTAVTQQAQVEVREDKTGLVVLPNTTSLADVVRALNAVGATPTDLLAILQAMKAAGALQAELEVI